MINRIYQKRVYKDPFFSIGEEMELKKPLMHVRLHQLGFFWWDPRIDPREPEYWGPDGGSFFYGDFILLLDVLINRVLTY